MVNFGATGNFINYMIAICYGFKLIRKKRLYYLFALDKNAIKIKNKQMIIQTDKLDIRILRGYIKDIEFDITNLRTYKLVLSML